MSFAVRTQAYSGPFDLLLQLVSRQKVAIGSISIAEGADQYLAEVSRMGELDLDVASDFLLVASTLLDMKAASLVPEDTVRRRLVDDEDEEDLSDLTPEEAREVLIARLIAYKQFRNAAMALAGRMESEALMAPRTAGADPEFLNLMPAYLEGISLRSLAVICAAGILGWRLFAKAGRRASQRFHEALTVEERREGLAATMTVPAPAGDVHHLVLGAGSPAVGGTVVTLNIRAKTGASVVAVVRDGTMTRNIGPEWEFRIGDELLVLGDSHQIVALKDLLGIT